MPCVNPTRLEGTMTHNSYFGFRHTPRRVAIGLGLLAISLRADPLDNWHVRARDSGGFGPVVASDNLVVCLGKSAVWTSDDGTNWVSHLGSNPPLVPFTGMAFGNGTFVSVAGSTIGTSTDGADWTFRTLAGESNLRQVAFGNGIFAAGGSATVWSSVDGINWTVHQLASPVINNVSVAFDGSQFLAVYGFFYTSPDGQNWIEHPGSLGWPNCLVSNGRTVVLSVSSSVVTSSDFSNWNTAPGNMYILSLAFGNGQFVGVGPSQVTAQFTTNTTIWTSLDGNSWIGRTVAGDYQSVGFSQAQDRFYLSGKAAIAQSDPVPRIQQAAVLRAALYPGITITGTVGKTYRVDRTPNLDAPTWTPVGEATLLAPTQLWYDPGGVPAGGQFYRLVEIVP